MEQKRQFYRVEYPKSARPTFICDKSQFAVVELSEEGIRLAVKGSSEFRVHQLVVGEIVFHDHSKVKVTASVFREFLGYVVLKCHVGIPLPKIMEEQRYLINKFGGVRRGDGDE